MNQELYQLYWSPGIIRRWRWAANVQIMDSILEGRTVERLKRRWMDGWMDGVVEDMRKMGIQGRQGQSRGKSSTGSQGSLWAVTLLLIKVSWLWRVWRIVKWYLQVNCAVHCCSVSVFPPYCTVGPFIRCTVEPPLKPCVLHQLAPVHYPCKCCRRTEDLFCLHTFPTCLWSPRLWRYLVLLHLHISSKLFISGSSAFLTRKSTPNFM